MPIRLYVHSVDLLRSKDDGSKSKTNNELPRSQYIEFTPIEFLFVYHFDLLWFCSDSHSSVGFSFSYAFLAIDNYQGIFSFHIIRCAFSLPQSNQINGWYELY